MVNCDKKEKYNVYNVVYYSYFRRFLMKKTCSKCSKEKDIACFCKAKSNKDGLNGRCKDCVKIYQLTYRNEYYLKNKEKLNKKHKEYYLLNKDKMDEYYKSYREQNREQSRINYKEYYLLNKDKINKYKHDYVNSNIDVKIKHRLRCRISMAMYSKATSKCTSSSNLLGCSIHEFKKYLEGKFTKGMTWENYGKSGWHIDHIIPCDSFDLSIPDQQKKCFHYTNLQPLWATTNIAMQYGESCDYQGNLEKGNKS